MDKVEREGASLETRPYLVRRPFICDVTNKWPEYGWGLFCIRTTQKTGYCIETATQGETPFLSHNGKHQTYQRVPCESETGVGHHGAKDTLTATDGVSRDNAAPLDDNRTTGIYQV